VPRVVGPRHRAAGQARVRRQRQGSRALKLSTSGRANPDRASSVVRPFCRASVKNTR
jgi:hypothetical protein